MSMGASEENDTTGKTVPELNLPDWPKVRSLVDSYYDLQRLRIATESRFQRMGGDLMVAGQQSQGVDAPLGSDYLLPIQQLTATLVEKERGMARAMEQIAKEDPVYKWLRQIKGIGPVLACGLLATFDAAPHWGGCRQPPTKRCKETAPGSSRDNPEIPPCPHAGWNNPEHPSSYWKFAGYYPGARLVAGQKAPFSKKARVLCYKIGVSLIKCQNPVYVPLYEEAKARYAARTDFHDPKKKGAKAHVHMAALRFMVKRLLADMWRVQRMAKGLPDSEPYAIARLHHSPDHRTDAGMPGLVAPAPEPEHDEDGPEPQLTPDETGE